MSYRLKAKYGHDMDHLTATMPEQSDKPINLQVFDQIEFRRALASFPTGVAIMTSRDGQGEPVGLTCNSFSSVSLDPPLVLWSLRKASKSIDIFRSAKTFAINVLAEDQDHLSQHFATSSILKKFETIDWSTGYAGLPLIDDCVARFHCDVSAQHDAGDHIIFLGQVVKYEVLREDDSLVFYKGAYMMLSQSLRAIAQKGIITHDALAQSRLLIYGMLLTLACQNGEESDFVAIEKNLQHMDDMVVAGDMARRMVAALEFFNLISRAAHNEVMSLIAKSLNTLLQHTVKAKVEKNDPSFVYVPELDSIRWKILAALRARDKESAVRETSAYLEHITHSSSLNTPDTHQVHHK